VLAGHSYRLKFRDHPERDKTVPGRQILTEGIEVALPLPDSSEIVLLRQI